MVNLSSFVKYHALNSPERVAISYEGSYLTYQELSYRIERLAGFLLAKDLDPNDVVAVLMKNSPAFIEIAFAVSHIGAIFLPINYRLASKEVNYICENAEVKLLFADEEFNYEDLEAQKILIDFNMRIDSGLLCLGDGRAEASPRTPGDLFRLLYTSGTTSRPKGVVHTYQNFYWKCSDHSIVLGLNADTRLLVVGPLYHVGAFDLPGVGVLWRGGMLAIQRDFDPVKCLHLIEKEQLNAGWLAPVMTSAMLESAKSEEVNLSSMKWIIGGGERTPEKRIEEFSQVFTRARYIDAYGLTESGSGDTFMVEGRELEKIGSTGRATPSVEIKIINEMGVALPSDEVGEICLRGPKIFERYWRDTAKTNLAFQDDWFCTGDAGYLDNENFLYITDRLKDMIISGGENIASLEIERVIQIMPEVSEVAVVGVPDETWGEVPGAFVVCGKDHTLTLDRVREHCGKSLASFKIPKKLTIRDTLPRNPSGKLLKRLIRADGEV